MAEGWEVQGTYVVAQSTQLIRFSVPQHHLRRLSQW
jgi:hypothetical protein